MSTMNKTPDSLDPQAARDIADALETNSPREKRAAFLAWARCLRALADELEQPVKQKRTSFTLRWLEYSGPGRNGLDWRIGAGSGVGRRAPNQSTSQGLHALLLALQSQNTDIPLSALYSLDAKDPAHAMTEAIRDAKKFLLTFYNDELEAVLSEIQFSEKTGAIRYSPQNNKCLFTFKY
jgi:hypothetical protein